MARRFIPKGPRGITESRTGRVRWKPGDPQLLDEPDDQRANLGPQLHAARASLLPAAQQTQAHLSLLHHLEQVDDPTAPFASADLLISRLVTERFYVGSSWLSLTVHAFLRQ
jgi:hypothetical protein